LLAASLLLAAPTHGLGQADPSRHSGSPDQIYLIIRSDDAGMSHSVNMGLEKQYFGETRHDPQYLAASRNKTDSLLAMVQRLHSHYNLVVTHVGIDDSELGASLDMNKGGALPEMSKNRQGELDALTSSRFRDALAARNVRLLTYRQLVAIQGLQSMQRPEG